MGTAVKNSDGTWGWSYTPADDAGQPSTVAITADDGEAVDNISSITFGLTVNDLPPALTMAIATVTVNEGEPATNSGTWSDVPADWPNVTLSASVGTVTKSDDGTWDWSYAPQGRRRNRR